MATVTGTRLNGTDIRNARYRWTGFAISADVGTAVSTDVGNFTDRSVQVLGTFTGGLTIAIQGSNDGGTNWATLTDPLGNALSFTAAGLKSISEAVHLMRPIATAGSGSAAVDVYLFMAGNRA